jgi:hypothetical protein
MSIYIIAAPPILAPCYPPEVLALRLCLSALTQCKQRSILAVLGLRESHAAEQNAASRNMSSHIPFLWEKERYMGALHNCGPHSWPWHRLLR